MAKPTDSWQVEAVRDYPESLGSSGRVLTGWPSLWAICGCLAGSWDSGNSVFEYRPALLVGWLSVWPAFWSTEGERIICNYLLISFAPLRPAACHARYLNI